jgi:hypothetical protein
MGKAQSSRRAGYRALSAASALLAIVVYSPVQAGATTATTFTFSSGNPDGKMAMASRPGSSGKPEIEAADDFVLTAPTAITHATFTGLLPASGSVQLVNLEIYGVFPVASNASRIPMVPTRVNSPSDNDLVARESTSGGKLTYSIQQLSGSFTAANSVLNGIHPLPNQKTGGDGPVTGREVVFSATLNNPFVLPAGHYFFVPQVQVSGPASSNFYWLSSPHPVAAPGTPFPAGTTDLQAWIRNSALEPDWLRVGTDIVGGATPPVYNAAFTLNNAALPIQSSTKTLSSGVGIRLSVKIPTAGTLQVSDPLVGKPGGHKAPWFNAVTKSVSPRLARLTIVPNAAGRKQLAKKRTIHLLVEVTFTPPGGQPSTRTITITWRRR